MLPTCRGFLYACGRGYDHGFGRGFGHGFGLCQHGSCPSHAYSGNLWRSGHVRHTRSTRRLGPCHCALCHDRFCPCRGGHGRGGLWTWPIQRPYNYRTGPCRARPSLRPDQERLDLKILFCQCVKHEILIITSASRSSSNSKKAKLAPNP
jgi:hypothetical protein